MGRLPVQLSKFEIFSIFWAAAGDQSQACISDLSTNQPGLLPES